MLDIIMQLEISVRLTFQVTIIICPHMKKKNYSKNTKKYEWTRPKPIC